MSIVRKHLKNVTYRITRAEPGSGYKQGETVTVPDGKVEDIAKSINRKARLQFTAIDMLEGDRDRIVFGRRMDGIVSSAPVMIVERVREN